MAVGRHNFRPSASASEERVRPRCRWARQRRDLLRATLRAGALSPWPRPASSAGRPAVTVQPHFDATPGWPGPGADPALPALRSTAIAQAHPGPVTAICGMSAGTAGHDHPVPGSQSPLAKAPLPRVEASVAAPQAPPGATGVLADRIAAALVHREPGWRLPRRSALARRYGVSLTEIDAAIAELARRSLVRRLADGQLYRSSPADYWIPVEGVSGFGTRLDPMGSAITCQTRHVSRREAPQDVAWALGVPVGAEIRVVRCVWSAAGEPAAVSTAYLHEAAQDEAERRRSRSRRRGEPGDRLRAVVLRLASRRPAGRGGEHGDEPAAARRRAQSPAGPGAAGDHGDGQVRRPRHRQPVGAHGRHAQTGVVQSCDRDSRDSGQRAVLTRKRVERLATWTRVLLPATLNRDVGQGRDTSGTDATAGPVSGSPGPAPP